VGVASQIVRLAEYLKMEYPEGSPELAVEIVSPSNTKKKLAEKIELYLANGSLAVWVVYPKKRTVVLWESGGKKSEFGEGDILCLPTAISDRAIQVSEIFSVLA
jgi:Uma2 family endonuclease